MSWLSAWQCKVCPIKSEEVKQNMWHHVWLRDEVIKVSASTLSAELLNPIPALCHPHLPDKWIAETDLPTFFCFFFKELVLLKSPNNPGFSDGATSSFRVTISLMTHFGFRRSLKNTSPLDLGAWGWTSNPHTTVWPVYDLQLPSNTEST